MSASDQDPIIGVNEFSNDGSFIERFKQLQKKEEERKDATTPSPVAVPKSVPFRLAGVKRRIKPAETETPGSSSAAQTVTGTEDKSGRGQPRPSTQG